MSTSCERRTLPGLVVRAVVGWALLVPTLSAATAQDAPVLESDSSVATAGFFQLKWEGGPSEVSYELQEATQDDFSNARVFYRGPDLATVLSGKPDGDYYYRIRFLGGDGSSSWSAPVHVEVESHPLSRALTFLALGAVVFLATVIVILRGEIRTRHPLQTHD